MLTRVLARVLTPLVPATLVLGGAFLAPSAAVSLAPAAAVSAERCDRGTVVLLHDVLAVPESLATIGAALRDDGWCTVAPVVGRNDPPFDLLPGGTAGVDRTADDVASVLAEVEADRRGRPVHVVGHGVGALAALRAVQRHPESAPASITAIAPLWDGTDLAGLGTLEQLSRDLGTYPLLLAIEAPLEDPVCRTCRDLVRGSDLLREMWAAGTEPPGVRITSIVSRTDLLSQPWSPSTRSVGTTVVLQDRWPLALAGHFTMPHDPAVVALVRDAVR